MKTLFLSVCAQNIYRLVIKHMKEIHCFAKQSWETVFWQFLHTISLYPLTHFGDEDNICSTFEHLEHIIPCSKFKANFQDFKKTNDVRVYLQDDRKLGMFRWTVDFHNTLNVGMGVPMMSFTEALRTWATFLDPMEQ